MSQGASDHPSKCEPSYRGLPFICISGSLSHREDHRVPCQHPKASFVQAASPGEGIAGLHGCPWQAKGILKKARPSESAVMTNEHLRFGWDTYRLIHLSDRQVQTSHEVIGHKFSVGNLLFTCSCQRCTHRDLSALPPITDTIKRVLGENLPRFRPGDRT